MELVIIIVAALVSAIILTLVFSANYRSGGPWAGLWIFFVVILLFGLAGGIWTSPLGPAYGGVPWFGILFWALLVALSLAAFAAPRRARRRQGEAGEAVANERVMGWTFWLLIALLFGAVLFGVARYL